ncbi:MAG: carbon monoxide dehydrogenase subunit G [Nitrososphaerales archaeon]
MKINGSLELKRNREEVYRFFLDPNRLAKCLPDLQELKVKDENNFDTKFKVGLAHIKGTVSVSFNIAEKVENEKAKLVGRGSGVGSVMDLTIFFKLSDFNGGTKVDWEADVKVGGMLAGIGSRLMSPVVKKNTKLLIESIKRELGE